MIKPFPLRYSLPLLLLLFGAVLTCVLIADGIRLSNRHIEAEARLNLESLGDRFATQLEYFYSHGNMELVERGNASMSKIPHLRSSAIFDESNQRVVSTRAKNKAPVDFVVFSRARQTGAPQIQLRENDKLLTGVFPFRLGAGRLGMLYVEMDLLELKNMQIADDFKRAELFCVLALLLVILSWLYLDRMLTQRIACLIAATREMAAGNLSRRTALEGMDELAELGVSFNQMAEQIQRRTGEVKQSEAHYRRLVETAYEGILEIDQTQKLVLVNRRMAEMLGYTMDAMTGELITDFLFPEDVFDHQQRMAGRQFSDTAAYECRFRSRSGETVWGIMSVNYQWNESGGFAGAFCMVTDITQRKQAELQLLLQSSALMASASAVMITDGDGLIKWVNPAFIHLTGYTATEAIGQSPKILRSGSHPTEFYAAMWDTIKSGKIWQGEMINRRKTGENYTEHMTVAPIKDANGNITHFVAVKEDITEQRRFEQQLREAQKMEAVARLAGGVALDFNNSLTVIMGYADILQESQRHDPDIQEMAVQISESARRATNLTRQLSIFSQQHPSELQILNLNQILDNLFNIIKHLLGDSVVLQWDLSPVLPDIQADPDLLQQAVIALVAYAKDSMPQAGRLQLVTAHVEVDKNACRDDLVMRPGNYVCLTLSDTGVGMAPEKIQRVFEPFVEKGLSLAMVHSIINQHQGWIQVGSRLNVGTTFKIFLPVALPVTAVAPEIPALPRSDAPAGLKTILMVEDDKSVRNLICMCLRRAGFEVLTASDGAAAQCLWNEHFDSIDLLLTDIILPGDLNGADLADQFRRLRPTLKVIVSSGLSYERAKVTVPNLAEYEYLAKPYNPEKLLKIVRKVLNC